MIYFFSDGQRFVRCEVLPGEPHVLRLVQPDGAEHTECYYSAVQLDDRWSELRGQLVREGWSGPFGRDGRS